MASAPVPDPAIHYGADEATTAPVRSGLPRDGPVLIGADHLSGFGG
jgi:hypothetical protein